MWHLSYKFVSFSNTEQIWAVTHDNQKEQEK